MQNMQRRPFFLMIPVVVIAILLSIMTPRNISKLTSHPHPAKSYTEALQRFIALQAKEQEKMNPLCLAQLMTHNKQTDRAIVLVHGYTNCPQQFYELGVRFYHAGYNVLIAPLPHHGQADRMTTEHAQLTAEELAAYADETIDIACGLGKKVTMMGISAGGVTTAWAAQNRSDLDLGIIISPAFGFKQVPTPLTAAAMNIFRFLPDSFEWWDPVLKEKVPPAHTYPRYSRHALVEILRLGYSVQAEADRKAPAAKRVVVILNANDNMINNDLTMKVVNIWKEHQAGVTTYEFPANLKLPHDIIGPSQPTQRIDIVYPRIMELIKQAANTEAP